MFTANGVSTPPWGASVAPDLNPLAGSMLQPGVKSGDRGVRSLRRSLLLALFLLVSAPSQADPIRVFFERNVDGQAGNDLAVVSYPTLADLIGNTISITQFSQVDIDRNLGQIMVDRYAKFATEHLTAAASRIESDRLGENVVKLLRFPYGGQEMKKPSAR